MEAQRGEVTYLRSYNLGSDQAKILPPNLAPLPLHSSHSRMGDLLKSQHLAQSPCSTLQKERLLDGSLLEYLQWLPGHVAQLVGASSCELKGHGFNSWWSTRWGCEVSPSWGACKRQLIDVSHIHVSLLPPLLSLESVSTCPWARK